MVLTCPKCLSQAELTRSLVLGQWMICPACERPFAWRNAHAASAAARQPEGRTTSNAGDQQ